MPPPTDKRQPIILIGPSDHAGETVGSLLASQLEIPFIDLWEISQLYWEEIGFQIDLERQARKNSGTDGVYRYLIPFVAHSIKRGVTEHNNCVIKLGALQSVIDDYKHLQNIIRFLEPFSVFLLLPSEDSEKSVKIMRERNSDIIDGKEMNEHFLTHRSNFDLARHTFYTKDKTPEQTTDEILTHIDANASEIILIGAQGVGKSTVGELLAQKLDIPQISMDRMRWQYYEENGWSREQQDQIEKCEGFVGVYRYWKQYDLHAVERLLNEHRNCVFDFGAGHSVYERFEDLIRARELLAPCANVVLLMPSSDIDESVALLHQRRTMTISGMDIFEFVITHPSNRKLANHVVYTDGRTAIETKDEILKKLELA